MESHLDAYPKVSATDAGADFGRVLDLAQQGPVTIVRRDDAKFVLLQEDDYERCLASATAEAPPRLTLDQLLAGYDRSQHRSDWPDDAPRGRETL